LKSKESQEYVRSFPKRERVNLAELYPGTDARGIELLYKMLEFDPNQRITAEQALQNSFFDEIRLPH
jgi:serine/threonine protein kinase